MNILFCSVGRRVELIKEFRKTMSGGKIVVTDVSTTAPAIYVADKFYTVGRITDNGYVEQLLRICKDERIDVITTLIDPEIEILAKYRNQFEKCGIIVLAPDEKTAKLCYDKEKLITFLGKKGLRTVRTWRGFDSFEYSLNQGEVKFPVFVKPCTGSGSVGARKIEDKKLLKEVLAEDSSLIIQEYMGNAQDLDADVYIDAISHEVVSIFSKKKLETKIGGASKAISFKDEKLNAFIKKIVKNLCFNGPIDIDFFYRDGEYFLSEINPRFGGAGGFGLFLPHGCAGYGI